MSLFPSQAICPYFHSLFASFSCLSLAGIPLFIHAGVSTRLSPCWDSLLLSLEEVKLCVQFAQYYFICVLLIYVKNEVDDINFSYTKLMLSKNFKVLFHMEVLASILIFPVVWLATASKHFNTSVQNII